MKKYVLGIAGFIGSGKTTAGSFFQQKGAFFIEADKVVNDLYLPGHDGYLKVIHYFGKDFLNKKGMLDRKKLAKFVFSDIHKLKILNFLLHPLVTNEVQKILDQVKNHFIVLEATYFEKKHLGRLINELLWIECPLQILQKYGLQKEGMTYEKFDQIFKTQSRPAHVDYTVVNNGSKKIFRQQIERLFASILMKYQLTI